MNHYKDELGYVGYDSKDDYTFMEFARNVETDGFIKLHEKVVDMLKSMSTYSGKHLVDTSRIKTISLEGQAWVVENVVPLIQKKSRSDKALIAVVLSKDVFGKFAAENISRKTNEISDTVFFKSHEDALAFLLK